MSKHTRSPLALAIAFSMAFSFASCLAHRTQSTLQSRTASGTLRRNPEIAYLKSPLDADKLVGVQDRLLDAAYTHTKESP